MLSRFASNRQSNLLNESYLYWNNNLIYLDYNQFIIVNLRTIESEILLPQNAKNDDITEELSGYRLTKT